MDKALNAPKIFARHNYKNTFNLQFQEKYYSMFKEYIYNKDEIKGRDFRFRKNVEIFECVNI